MRVQWVPNRDDLFFSWGNDLVLYQVNCPRDTQPISYNFELTELATYSDIKLMRCLAVRPPASGSSRLTLAVGQSNGTALLATIQTNNWELSCVNRFAARYERQCNTLSWEMTEGHLLAVGLDRHRHDHSINIWDTNVTTVLQQTAVNGRLMVPVRPYMELASCETTMSLAWLRHCKSLVAGVNNRVLRVYDLRARDPSKVQLGTSTRLVYGVCTDPFVEHRLATFADNQVAIWDERNFEQPVSLLTDVNCRSIVCIGWSPTRRDCLASLGRESGALKLHYVDHYAVRNDEIEPCVSERDVHSVRDERLADFSWHQTNENRMLVATVTGDLLDFSIFERVTMNWSPAFSFVWSNARRRVNMEHSRPFKDKLSDISVLMRERAIKGYGLAERVVDNGRLVDDESLRSVWSWISLSQQVNNQASSSASTTASAPQTSTSEPSTTSSVGVNSSASKRPFKPFRGVRSVLDAGNGTPSVIELRAWFGVDRTTKCKIYRSEGRDTALRLCGWGVDDMEQAALLETLERRNCHARAAAVAVFQLNIRRAIQILKRSKGQQQQVVALALSGFTSDARSLWQITSRELITSISDAYVRVILAFLTAPDDQYDTVLQETAITVQDRVAIACRFLSDERLNSFLECLCAQLKAEADLHAILITGVCNDSGMDLLQLYVNRYGDVQSAALIAAHTAQTNNKRAMLWIEWYRQLLDLWRLWEQRALFDINVLYQNVESRRNMDQVSQSVVACNYCNKSVSAVMDDVARKRQLVRTGATTKVICCRHCRKSLPRCALCLVQLGTASSCRVCQPATATAGGFSAGEASAPFDTWFTWCQTCRHGGHAAHMAAWFADAPRVTCPVAGCSCRCMALDSVPRLLPDTTADCGDSDAGEGDE